MNLDENNEGNLFGARHTLLPADGAITRTVTQNLEKHQMISNSENDVGSPKSPGTYGNTPAKIVQRYDMIKIDEK